MRKDRDRVFIFPLNPFTCLEENKRIFISPVEAIILAFFNGQRNIGEVAEEIAYILDCDPNQAVSIAVNCLTKNKALIVPVNEVNSHQIIKYQPNEFIIAKNDIDLTTNQPKIPEVVMYIPTFSCDYDCIYCYAPGNKVGENELDLLLIKGFLRQMQEWRIPSLFLSGGDPFNYRQIRELLVCCLDMGIKPIIPTKTPLEPDMIDFVVNNKIDEMQFSVDTAQADVSRILIGRGEEYLQKLFSSMQMMMQKGIRIYTNTVVTTRNIKSIVGLVEILIALGVKQMTFSQYSRSCFRHFDTLFCDFKDLIILERQINGLKMKHPDVKIYYKYLKDHTFMDRNEKELFFKNIPDCTAGKMGMVILPDGLVTVCENLYYQKGLILGDLKHQTLEEIWFSRQRRAIVDQSSSIFAAGACLSCTEAKDCYHKKGKCFVRALQAFGDIRMPDPFCPRSEGGARIL